MKAKIILAAFLFSSLVHGQTTPKAMDPDQLTLGAKTSQFSEGTETTLSVQQIEEIKAWAGYSRNLLVLVERSSKEMRDKGERIKYMRAQIEKTVLASQKQTTELLMRYVLNRALVILEVIDRETSSDDPGVLDAKVILLAQSVAMAMRYYDHDLTYLNKRDPKNAPALLPAFAHFAVEYARFLSDLANSVMDASAQFQLYKIVLGLYHWDLARDNERLKYADHINRIYEFLHTLPLPQSDTEAIQLTRQMKQVLADNSVRWSGRTVAEPGTPSLDGDSACTGKKGFIANFFLDGVVHIGMVEEVFQGQGLQVMTEYRGNRQFRQYVGVECLPKTQIGFRLTRDNSKKCIGHVCEGKRAFYKLENDTYVGDVFYVFSNNKAFVREAIKNASALQDYNYRIVDISIMKGAE